MDYILEDISELKKRVDALYLESNLPIEERSNIKGKIKRIAILSSEILENLYLKGVCNDRTKRD